MKGKNWTPVDSFVTEYGFKHNKIFEYQPGSGEATMKTGAYMELDDLRALIKSIEHHELQINIEGTIFIYQPEEPGDEPEAPEEAPENIVEPPIEEPEEIAEAVDPELEEGVEIIVEEEEKPPEAINVVIPE